MHSCEARHFAIAEMATFLTTYDLNVLTTDYVTVHTPCKRKDGGAPNGGFSAFSTFSDANLLLP